MDRSASAAFIAELLKSSSQPIFMVEVYFDDITYRLTDAYRDVLWNSNTYVANGHFLGFDGLTETADLQIPSVRISVSAVDQVWIAIALSKPYVDRRVAIYKAFLDNTQAVVSSPVLIFDGRIDSMEIADDPDSGSCTISISASSQWVDFERRPGRRTNHEEQQVWFPGDKGFEYASEVNKQIKWGAA